MQHFYSPWCSVCCFSLFSVPFASPLGVFCSFLNVFKGVQLAWLMDSVLSCNSQSLASSHKSVSCSSSNTLPPRPNTNNEDELIETTATKKENFTNNLEVIGGSRLLVYWPYRQNPSSSQPYSKLTSCNRSQASSMETTSSLYCCVVSYQLPRLCCRAQLSPEAFNGCSSIFRYKNFQQLEIPVLLMVRGHFGITTNTECLIYVSPCLWMPFYSLLS